MSAIKTHPALILGSGPAGWTAAIYLARALREPILLKGLDEGGQLSITTDVENYPGFADTIQGPWLMEQMEAQARKLNVDIIADLALSADLSKRPFTITTDRGKTWHCDSLIIATGAQAKWLGLKSESHYRGFGVSACATCDGFFYRDKKVAVIGGGNSAAEEALFLCKFASEVFLIHRRGELRAEALLAKRVLNEPKIKPIWHHVLDDIHGDDNPKSVRAMTLRSTQNDHTQKMDIDGIFIAIGHQPQSDLFKNQLEMKNNGVIITKPFSTQTSQKGVFAAGDVADDVFRQAVTAASMGCMAALEADDFLKDQTS